MPEGHTLHRLAGALGEHLTGAPLRVSSPQGRFADGASQVNRTVLEGAEAWGKHLFLRFAEERLVHVHLGLYGRFDITPGAAAAPVGQVRLRLEGPAAHADLRGATACKLVTAAEQEAVVARLGPDPLRDDADPERAWQRISRSRAPLGTLLMDQSVVAGVGNVYRAEVLFRHRLHPLRPGNRLTRRTFDVLWRDLATLMREGVRTGRIDTVRDEHTPQAMGRPARRDDHGGEVYVYRRSAQPCLVCGSRVRTDVLAGRNLFWCPRCQRPFCAAPGRSGRLDSE